MKKSYLKLTLLALLITLMYSCGNSKTETVLTEDSFPDIPLDSCFTQGEINHYFARRATRHKDSILNLFNLYTGKFPTSSVKNEYALWNEYDSIATEAYKMINMSGFCGSSAPMGLYGFAYDIADQLLTSFAYDGTRHMAISDQMIEEAYARFRDHGIDDDYVENDPNDWYFTLEEKKNCLAAEQAAWNRWIAFRAEISSKLKGKNKELYDMRTNELRRMKLIQLKNQYQWYPLASNETYEHLLDPQCTDKQLQNYTYFDIVWEEYSKEFE